MKRDAGIALIAGLAVALACLHAAPSHACSRDFDFTPLSNYELVRESPLTVLARAVAFRPAAAKDDFELVTFEVLEVLSGAFEGERIDVMGDEGESSAATADDFARGRAGRGDCADGSYARDGLYVLILEQQESHWLTYGQDDRRGNEQVPHKDHAWVAAVRQYARIARLHDPAAEKQALLDLRERAARGDDPATYPPALVADIDRHFARPSAAKSFADLRDLFDRAADLETKEKILHSIVHGRKREASAFMRALIERDDVPPSFLEPLADFFAEFPDPGAVGALSRALPRARSGDERLHLRWAVVRCASSERGDALLPLLEDPDDEQVKPVAEWFVQHPDERARAKLRERIGQSYLAHESLTLALARMADEDVLAWALSRPSLPPDGAWLPTYVIAQSPLDRADARAAAIISSGGEELGDLIEGYEKADHPRRWARYEELLPMASESPKVWRALCTTLVFGERKRDATRAEPFIKRLGPLKTGACPCGCGPI